LASGDTAIAQTSSVEFGYGRAVVASILNPLSIAPVEEFRRASSECAVPLT
jgi:hypothetical protein